MSSDAHRVGDFARTPRRHPVVADAVTSSPPTRRLRSDSRHVGSAPAAPSLSASARGTATATVTAVPAPMQPRARSKPATQRRTAVAVAPSTCRTPTTHGGGLGSAANAAAAAHHQQQQQQRGRRMENASDGGSVLGERSSQRTRARKVSGGAASARRVMAPDTPPPPSPQPLPSSQSIVAPSTAPLSNTSTGLTSYQALQRLREMAGVPGSAFAYGSSNHSNGGGNEMTSPLTSPVVTYTPAKVRTAVSTSCTLPPMLSQSRPTQPSTPGENSTTNNNTAAQTARLSCSVPLLSTRPTTPERDTEHTPSHRVPLLTRFTQLMHPPTYSPVDSFTPPMPPINTHAASAPHTVGPAFSNLSSSTLTDSAVTPRGGGGGYLTWSPSGSMSDDAGTQPSQPSHQHQPAPATHRTSVREESRTDSPALATSRNANASLSINGGTVNGPSAAVASRAPPSAHAAASLSNPSTSLPLPIHHHHSSTSETHLQVSTEHQQQQQQQQSLNASASRSQVAGQRVLTGSSSASFGSLTTGSPTGLGSAALRPPPPPPPPSTQQQHPQQHTQKMSSPTVALPRDAHAPATVSPNPLRPPRANGATPRHVSVSAERRPLVAGASSGSTAAGATASTTTPTTSAVRAPSKSPSGTLSTEAAKRALKDRRRRELYAWNEMLRERNEAGVQDAV